jgi:putative transposase
LVKLWVHIVFGTRFRQEIIGEKIEDELYAYMSSILKSFQSSSLIINGTADHIHILCLQSKNYAIPKLVEQVKKNSSRWIKRKGARYSKFRWQGGYGAFSVSQSHVEMVRRYILKQKEHYRKRSYNGELREFLVRYYIPYDERYIWD